MCLKIDKELTTANRKKFKKPFYVYKIYDKLYGCLEYPYQSGSPFFQRDGTVKSNRKGGARLTAAERESGRVDFAIHAFTSRHGRIFVCFQDTVKLRVLVHPKDVVAWGDNGDIAVTKIKVSKRTMRKFPANCHLG